MNSLDTATSSEPATTPVAHARASHLHYAEFLHRWGLLLVLILAIVFFSIRLPDTFLQWSTFHDLIAGQAPSLVLALAAVLVLVVGEFDLSLGATFGITQYIALQMMIDHGVSVVAAMLLSLVLGALVGLINVALIVGAKVNSFIATIGVQTALIGLATLVSNGNQPIFAGAPESFTSIGNNQILTIPLSVWVALVVAALLWVVLDYTSFGRTMRATGANRVAARLSGLRTTRALVVALLVASVLAAFAGLLDAARTGTSDSTSGPMYLLPAYAAAFLGATGSKSSTYSVPGTILAILLVAVGVTGLQLMGAASWVTNFFNGVVLLAAVLLSQLARKRSG
ncbi:ABC transporter permease [Nocardioides sp. KIGAM211]|uniref:ABC transporter permease n=1 Tax=Nocardioides luti TaxID=2761101 RepID=A0A7X0RGF5_9ACTN|nr:ABC transporter permease [Nocardioides luti]MBB6627802.1 ABC transporter permease [Nocardioides luti]